MDVCSRPAWLKQAENMAFVPKQTVHSSFDLAPLSNADDGDEAKMSTTNSSNVIVEDDRGHPAMVEVSVVDNDRSFRETTPQLDESARQLDHFEQLRRRQQEQMQALMQQQTQLAEQQAHLLAQSEAQQVRQLERFAQQEAETVEQAEIERERGRLQALQKEQLATTEMMLLQQRVYLEEAQQPELIDGCDVHCADAGSFSRPPPRSSKKASGGSTAVGGCFSAEI